MKNETDIEMHVVSRLSVLDGWRGISILLVLAAHLLPLGPKQWRLNEVAGTMGMALFFTLSGFLITRVLLANQNVLHFLIKRFLRIVPLAWVAILVGLFFTNSSVSVYLAHLFFYANLPPIALTNITSHLWSLCVEMQFYMTVALIVGFLGRRGLLTIPILCICVTIYRIWIGATIDIVTIKRVDEILAGGVLALMYNNEFGTKPSVLLSKFNPYLLAGFLFVASSPDGEWMNYLRPYFAASLVGSTLIGKQSRFTNILSGRTLAYIATISFALYVIHGVLRETWFGSGNKMEKYLKRPLLFGATFGLAHLSTFYFESRFIKFGKKYCNRHNQ